ncbi:MAG: flagellar hook-length control protein FliK [Dissulfurimicrobium sp.]|uniref:flagellar hook-length control protein FliK n=1 Tax=Dissulfurimicrobium sp. TaxID=2022436 RepID=UPI00404B8966
MQILPQGLNSQIDAVSPDIKSGLTALTSITSNRGDSSFQDLLRVNQRAIAKETDQPRNQDKKAASSAFSKADNQPDVNMPDKNNSYETVSSCKIPKDTKMAQTNQDPGARQAGEFVDKTGKIQNDKADDIETDTADVLLALFTIEQQSVNVQNAQTTGQIQGSNAEFGAAETASTKNGPVSTGAYPPPVYTQGDAPLDLPNTSSLTPRATPLTQQAAAQTPAKDPASQDISQEMKIAAGKPSTETFMKDVTPSMSGVTSQDAAMITDKGAGQTLQSSQTSAASLGAALSNNNSTSQTNVNNAVGTNATDVMSNQGVDKANKTTESPLSATVNTADGHRQISGQTNLQSAQANSAPKAADIAAQLIQGPKDQKIAKGPQQNVKGAAATTQAVTVGDKTTEVKIGSDNNRQDDVGINGINAGSDNAGKTANPQEDPKIVKMQDQMPDQFVSMVANNAADKTSNGIANGIAPSHIDLINKKDLAQTIKDQVFSNLSAGDKHVVLHLDPPDLGKIRIDLTLTSNNNELRVTFTADHPDIRNIIQGQMDGLKQHLDHKGFNVTQIKIDSGMQTGFTSLDQRDQGSQWSWAQEALNQPASKTNIGQGINDATADIIPNAILSRNVAQNGRVNLVI